MIRFLLVGMIVIGPFLQAQPSAEKEGVPRLGIVEKLGNVLPLDAEVVDEKGNVVPLRSLLNKTTIVTFVYYRCASICSPLLTELSRVVEKMDLEIGKDYQILTISFDHRETPELGSAKRESYLASMQKPIDPAGWRFLTADSLTVRRLTDAAGFYFKPDGDQWIHAAALIIVSPEGKITRYINGIQYLPFDVKMALIEGMEGREGPTVARLLRFCYRYDPEGRTYALHTTRIAGVVIVVLAALFVGVFIVRPKRKNVERKTDL
jgi:protein SCO1